MLGRQPKLIATMKKLFLIVAAMFAVVSFSACSDVDDKDASIVGTWRHTREVGYEIYNGDKHEIDSTCSEANQGLILNEDVTGKDTFDGSADNFTYTVNGKTLKKKYDGDDGWAEITINELTNSSLVLYEHGEQEETTNYYTRKLNQRIARRVTDFVKRLIYKTLLQSLSLSCFVYSANNLIFIKINNN